MVDKNIWGTICECGQSIYGFYDDHPWNELSCDKEIICNKCGKVHLVTQIEAQEFYNNLIFDCFKNVKGKVLELGCGGGLLTNYLSTKSGVDYLVAVDKDVTSSEFDDEEDIIKNLGSDKFIKMNLDSFDEDIFEMKFDYIVCRDVVMYLNDLDYTFSKLSNIGDNLVLLNWYNKEHKNCINKTTPSQFVQVLEKYYNDVEISYPYFYKYGYLINAKKKKA